MANMRVMICDDEVGMRLVLRRLIESVEGFEVCAEASDGEEAVLLFSELKPDAVFLDVQMPKIDGVECARRIQDLNPRTAIIFATAHESYMSDAFSVYAFDYLLKPFKGERVVETLNRLRDFSTHKSLPVFDSALRSRPEGLQRLMLKNREGISVVDMADILLVQRENRLTVLYTQDEALTSSETLSQIEQRLEPGLFFRCHKSYIVNISAIENITPYGRWTYIVKLKGTKRDALITHDRLEQLQELFA